MEHNYNYCAYCSNVFVICCGDQMKETINKMANLSLKINFFVERIDHKLNDEEFSEVKDICNEYEDICGEVKAEMEVIK